MNANLVLLGKNGSTKAFALPKPVTILGRRHDCDLRIPLPMVSRKHCQLTANGELVKLRDLGSRAGTFVNGKKVEAETDISIKPGDYIAIGPLTFVCQIDGKPVKIAPPKQKSASQAPKAKPTQQKAPAAAPSEESDEDIGKGLDDELDGKLSDELDDMDVSDSFINLDELDADLEDIKDA